MVRIGPDYLLGSGIAMLLLGQIAVLWPAMRAAKIPPALAIRGSP
jgi:putative ABC transport system permease protein